MRFGSFDLDPESGDLWTDDDDRRLVTRLPPQPARLLAHLVERRPHLVGQDEIRQLLWPDVEVEFDESLHSCVRKIRAALGDSATSPVFIETVPRRGYRFIGTVPEDPTRIATSAPAARRPWRLAVVAAAILAAVLGLGRVFGPGSAAEPPARVAVMSFDLAEATVRELVARHGQAIEVVGPTTTHSYTGRVRDLIADYEIDVVINARDTVDASGPRVLLEIIRARDGAHVWVKYLDELEPGREASAIAEALPPASSYNGS
jgi:DNA-binding winged helix-turn-helix (wHTH) protein